MAKINTGDPIDLQTMSKAEAKIGDFKWSRLGETEFNDEHLGTWYLCDGRSSVGTLYETLTTETSVPNALTEGTFIRQAKAGRTPGTFEADENKEHRHYSVSTGYGGQQTNVAPADAPVSYYYNRSDDTTYILFSNSGETATKGGTSLEGAEARPKNIALNLYVKVDY